jgi:ribokinase
MKIINFGSLNLDHVYRVERFVSPGETVPCLEYTRFCGGKGLNQSIALARAGATVFHYGKIGRDGAALVRALREATVDTRHISEVDGPTGHAVIQVTDDGENSIIIEGGANQKMDSGDTVTVFGLLSDGDWLLVQNEINGVADIFDAAHQSRCRLAFNPAPMTAAIAELPLARVDLLIVNETEGQILTGEMQTETILARLRSRCPRGSIVITLGGDGAVCLDGDEIVRQPPFVVEAVDTTGAGDTFVGYFLAAFSGGASVREALELGCRAASLCVTRPGAADSIPMLSEVEPAPHHPRHQAPVGPGP